MDPNTLANTQTWFKLAKPKPTNRDFHTQLGCHLEEVGEMLEELSSTDTETTQLLVTATAAVNALGEHLKGKNNLIDIRDFVKFLDAICDQIVTGTGTGYMCDMDVASAMVEVNRSNYSKFVKGLPVFNEVGKIMKGPDYTPADLRPFV